MNINRCFLLYVESQSVNVYGFSQKEKTLELEKSVESLNEQLTSARTESTAKDNLLSKQSKVAEEAIAGQIIFSPNTFS